MEIQEETTNTEVTPTENTEQSVNKEVKQEKIQENVINVSRGSAQKNSGDGVNKNPIIRRAPAMDDETYIRDRLDAQMNWYDAKSSWNQKKYKSLKKWEIVISASIPLIIALSTTGAVEKTVIWGEVVKIGEQNVMQPYLTLATLFQIIAALCGVFMVVLNKYFELEGYYDNWKKYRTTAEEMQNERIKYLTHTDPYDEDDAFPVLVANIEGILNKENMTWQQTMSKVKTAGLRKKAQSSIDNMFEEQKKKGKKQKTEGEPDTAEKEVEETE